MFSAGKTSRLGYSSAFKDSINTTKRNRVALPREVLDQLTKFLWIEPSIEATTPDASWFHQQEAGLKGLDESLRLPKSLIKQLVARVNNHRHPARFAHLCSFHLSLNPRVIRHIMLLVASELTKRTDRFRSWRNRITLPDCIKAWLDRVDAATALWIGRDAFFAAFGHDQPGMVVQSVESGCEACILGVVGGRPQLLIDLRASMFARQGHHHTHVEPRLWRIVDSWITQFDDDVYRGIVAASDVLAEQITKLNRTIEIEEKRIKVFRKGLSSRRRPRRKTSNIKPPKPHRTSKDRGSNISSFLGPQSIGHSKPVGHFKGETRLNMEHPRTPTSQDAWDDNVDETDNETWAWMKRCMQSRGLTPEQNCEMLRDAHLAFGECASPIATPNRLAVGRMGKDKTLLPKDSIKNSVRGSVRGNRRSSWVTITVHSDDGENDQTTEPEPAKVQPMPEIPEFPSVLAELERQQTQDGEVHNAEPFVPARRDWDKTEPSFSQERFPGPPASSVYSSHPGFRRSQAPLTGRVSSIHHPHDSYHSQEILCPGLRGTQHPPTSRLSHATCVVNSPSAVPSSVHSSHPGFQRVTDNKPIGSRTSYLDPPGGWI